MNTEQNIKNNRHLLYVQEKTREGTGGVSLEGAWWGPEWHRDLGLLIPFSPAGYWLDGWGRQ